jgi:phosphopentomutase
MPRAMILVLDSVGCGGAKDADTFGDAGADTLGHIAQACAQRRGDKAGVRSGLLRLPHLDAMGLGLLCEASTGALPPGLTRVPNPSAQWGFAIETSPGKDTPTGHWEIAGAPASFAWGYFPDTQPAFPPEMTEALIREGKLPGILGNRHAAGVAIIDVLGEEHLRTGKPIVYTSADSVVQIAAHEEAFGLQRLYDLCVIARRICDPWKVGRIIARPFVGTSKENFKRTPHRKDYAIPPTPDNILDRAAEAGRAIVSIGKIGDIFAHRNTGREIKGVGDMDLFDKTLAAIDELADGGLLFANYVDLDTDHGHRRDVPGYAAGLERFDARLPELLGRLKPGDLAIITADHGNDPTWRGTDHTREHIPVLAFGPSVEPREIGGRPSFADIGASVAKHLDVAAPRAGNSWI